MVSLKQKNTDLFLQKKSVQEEFFPLMSVYPLWKVLLRDQSALDWLFFLFADWLWEIESRCSENRVDRNAAIEQERDSKTCQELWWDPVGMNHCCFIYSSVLRLRELTSAPFSFLSPDSCSSHNCLCTAESYRHTWTTPLTEQFVQTLTS